MGPEAISSPVTRAHNLYLEAGAYVREKRRGTCEDAYFTDTHALGVADGVGCMAQFASYGINAAKYARELMTQAAASLKTKEVASEGPIDTRAIRAVSAAEHEVEAYGASTITLLV